MSVGTFLYIINPTPDSLKVLVAFFDPAGTCVLKQEQTLHPNATLEIVVPTLHLKPTFGAVKIISRLAKETGPNPKLGVVGFERHCIWGVGCWEGNLAGISGEVASPELERILADPCAP